MTTPQRLSLVIAAGLALAVALTARNLGDFTIFYTAARAVCAGVNPYTVPGFYSPLWVLCYFIPLSWLPLAIAFRLNALVSLGATGYAFWRITRGDVLKFWLLLAAPFALFTAWYGNLEWAPLLAAVVPPLAGFWLAAAKPQMGLILAGVLLFEMVRARRLLAASLTLSLLIVLTGLSFALGMRWEAMPDSAWNISAYPWGVPLGIGLAVASAVRVDRLAGLAATPLLSPYLGSPASWVGVLPLLSRRRGLLAIGVALAWGLLIVWRLRS